MSVIYAPLLFVIIMIRIQAVPTEALLLLLTHELLKYFFCGSTGRGLVEIRDNTIYGLTV